MLQTYINSTWRRNTGLTEISCASCGFRYKTNPLQKSIIDFECPRCKEVEEKKRLAKDIFFYINLVSMDKIVILVGSEYLERVMHLRKLGEQDENIRLEVEHEIEQFIKSLSLTRLKEIRDCLYFHVKKK